MSRIADTFDKRAGLVKQALSSLKEGQALPTPADETSFAKSLGEGLLSMAQVQENILLDMKDAVIQMDSFRKGAQDRKAVDLSLEQFVKQKFGFGSVESFYMTLGIDPSYHTMENLASMATFPEGYRWILPEVIREAVRLGLRRQPVYRDLIAGEETVSQKRVTMPSVNMSEGTPEVVNEMETIPVGQVSFNEKYINLRKIGTGIKVSDEVQKYVSLNVIQLYLQDAGVKLGLGFDTLAIDCLINGDSTDLAGTSAPVIGVTSTVSGITYSDILRMWLRMSRLGRNATGLLSAEDSALKILNMDEFKTRGLGVPLKALNVKTPVPQSSDYLLHGSMPTGDKLGFIDNTSALLKLNSTGLLVESERIASRQLNGTYITQTSGFAKMFRDAFIILDGTVTYSPTAGAAGAFPTWMDVSTAEKVAIS